jgi:hypothetical protein
MEQDPCGAELERLKQAFASLEVAAKNWATDPATYDEAIATHNEAGQALAECRNKHWYKH